MKNRIKQSFALSVLVAVRGSAMIGHAPAQTFKTLYSFTAGATNLDGAYPQDGLILSGNTLYGATWHGGSGGNGTVFALQTDGTAFRTLHVFAPGLQHRWHLPGAGADFGQHLVRRDGAR